MPISRKSSGATFDAVPFPASTTTFSFRGMERIDVRYRRYSGITFRLVTPPAPEANSPRSMILRTSWIFSP
jgi:hypothetical protein